MGFLIGTKSFLQQIKEKEAIENKNNDGYQKSGQQYSIIFSGIIINNIINKFISKKALKILTQKQEVLIFFIELFQKHIIFHMWRMWIMESHEVFEVVSFQV